MSFDVDTKIIDWLLEGDAAIRYLTHRDLLDEERPDLQARISASGWGARYLSARNANGHWGREFYFPKWQCSHYTLLDLKNMGLPRDNEPARQTVALILTHERRDDGGMGPGSSVQKSDVCVAGMVLNYASWFGAPERELVSIVDFLLGQLMGDGGFNCQSNRAKPHHSSLHSTLSVLEGFQQYLDDGHTHRAEEISSAMASAREFVLLHRFFRSDHTGEVINKRFLNFPYPFRWYYNVLRGLDHFAVSRQPWDERMTDALDHVMSKRRSDGFWAVNAAPSGAVHFTMEKAGKPSRWITFIACRIMRAYGHRSG